MKLQPRAVILLASFLFLLGGCSRDNPGTEVRLEASSISSFTLINADTNLPVTGFSAIANGATISYSSVGTKNLNIRANAASVGSIRFTLDGKDVRVENNAPYSVAGDRSSDYFSLSPTLTAGRHTLQATPYSLDNAAGTKGTALTLTFTVSTTTAVTPPTTPISGAQTRVSLLGEKWYINGRLTNSGKSAAGLLLNSRMVNATFEDSNPQTLSNWKYPDGTTYSATRNTNEFVAMIPTYASYGLNAVTVSLQGGRPKDGTQSWVNTAFNADGSLKSAYMSRMNQVIGALDDNGMVAILTLFYFGQDERLLGETAIKRAVDETVDWVLRQGYTNVVLEIANEINHPDFDHAILTRERVDELALRAKTRSGGRLLVSVSLSGGVTPDLDLREDIDFFLLHGNGQTASGISAMIDRMRGYSDFKARPRPIVFNEDSASLTNMNMAVSKGTSWGLHDRGLNNYKDGFQLMPVNWRINTPTKQSFFDRVRQLTR